MMAKDEAVIPGQGWVLIGDTDTAVPDITKFKLADEASFTGWTWLGNTSKENPPKLGKDGGDVKTHDTWDTPAMRSTVETTVYTMEIAALSVTKKTLDLAFPGGAWDDQKKIFSVPSKPGVVNKSVLVIMKDDVNGLSGFVFPNGALAIGDMPEIKTDGFFEINLKVTGNASPTDGSPLRFIPIAAK